MARSTTPATRRPLRARQRGVTLFGLFFWAFIVGSGAYLAVRVLPTLNEYFTVQRAVDQIAHSDASTVAAIRAAFDKQQQIEYSISSITGKDLVITKENDKVVIAFAYDKLIPIYGPVYILIKYEGRSR